MAVLKRTKKETRRLRERLGHRFTAFLDRMGLARRRQAHHRKFFWTR